VELGDRHLEGDGLIGAAGDGDAHAALWLPPLLAGLIDMPRAAHEHVRDEDEVAREEDEAPLPASFDLFHGAAY
jgi:hypothetical protein